MKNLIFYLCFLVALFFLISNCKNSNKKTEVQVPTRTVSSESETLLEFIEKSGDFINSKESPSVIYANEVYENLGKYLILDSRSKEEYVGGHIDGAINVPTNQLLNYLKDSISASAYEKIVLVCRSGQSIAYANSILRILGFGNTFTLRYGMSSWNKKFAQDIWIKHISNNYASKLETIENPKFPKENFPKIKTGKTNSYEIAFERGKELLEEGYKIASIGIDSLMKNPHKYYIINYWTKEMYSIGHLQGAVQYNPRTSLKKDSLLLTLPLDKPIVVYCHNGINSAFVTAYLRMLGYDAKSLLFGANSFMHSLMKTNPKIGKAFISETDIFDYPFITGDNSTNKIINPVSNVLQNQPTITPKKIQQKKQGGGC